MLGCIIQARMGSSRLPGKVMMNIDEKNTLLHYVIQQLKFSKLTKNIIIATTTSEKDDSIVDFATKMNLNHFRGEVDNVLDRYYQCAKNFSISTIVRISADDPLIDPTIVDRVIEKFYSSSYDYVSNTNPRTFPQGNEIEVFSFETLEWIQDKQIAGLASDTWGCEVRPNESEEGINQPWHWITIPIMGLTMGEIFYLKELAEDCSEDSTYEFMFVAPALPITGAVGSPINPLAIK